MNFRRWRNEFCDAQKVKLCGDEKSFDFFVGKNLEIRGRMSKIYFSQRFL